MTHLENNELSIIIYGVRYDAVEAKTEFTCEECDLRKICEQAPYCSICLVFDFRDNKCFKKSNKKFEK